MTEDHRHLLTREAAVIGPVAQAGNLVEQAVAAVKVTVQHADGTFARSAWRIQAGKFTLGVGAQLGALVVIVGHGDKG